MNAKNLVVVLVFSIFSAQFAWADLTKEEALGTAVTAATTDTAAANMAIAEDIKVNGGYVRFGRDGSVKLVANGPTIGQRLYASAVYVKDGVVYVVYETYKGARYADGQVIATVTYPVAKVGEWMASKPAETKEVAKAEAAPAPKAEEVKPAVPETKEEAPAPKAEDVVPAAVATT